MFKKGLFVLTFIFLAALAFAPSALAWSFDNFMVETGNVSSVLGAALVTSEVQGLLPKRFHKYNGLASMLLGILSGFRKKGR